MQEDQFAVYQGQIVMILEVFETTAFVSFEGAEEKEVRLSQLDFIN